MTDKNKWVGISEHFGFRRIEGIPLVVPGFTCTEAGLIGFGMIGSASGVLCAAEMLRSMVSTLRSEKGLQSEKADFVAEVLLYAAASLETSANHTKTEINRILATEDAVFDVASNPPPKSAWN